MVDAIIIIMLACVLTLVVRGMLRGTIRTCEGSCESCGHACGSHPLQLTSEQKARLAEIDRRGRVRS